MTLVELIIASSLLCIVVLPCMLLLGMSLSVQTFFQAWGVSLTLIATLVVVASNVVWIRRRFWSSSDKLE